MGLPGSGKTYQAKNDLKPGEVLFDDFFEIEALLATVREGKDIRVSDPNLCYPEARATAKRLIEANGGECVFVYFEYNPDQCRENIVLRGDGQSHLMALERISKAYVIPEGSRIVPVFSH